MLHNGFHVSRLRRYNRSVRFHKDIVIHPEALDIDEPDIYEVEQVISHRICNHRGRKAKVPTYEYLVKWIGYDVQQCTYIKEEDFLGVEARQIIKRYKEQFGL